MVSKLLQILTAIFQAIVRFCFSEQEELPISLITLEKLCREKEDLLERKKARLKALEANYEDRLTQYLKLMELKRDLQNIQIQEDQVKSLDSSCKRLIQKTLKELNKFE